jgi:hypothetical protein
MRKLLALAVSLTASALLFAGVQYARADLIPPAADGNVRTTVFGQLSVDTASFLLFANVNPVNDDRASLEFPLASIPGGNPITSATLRLNVVQTGGMAGLTGTFELYGYAGDGIITAGDFSNDQFLLQTFTHPVGTFGPRAFDVTSFVQGGVSEGNAFSGFLFKAVSQDTLVGFASSEHESPTLRPVLDVQFTPIPEPSTLILLGIGTLGLVGCGRHGRRRK